MGNRGSILYSACCSHLGIHGKEEAKLHTRRFEHERELNSLELALSQMEMEITRLHSDIGALGRLRNCMQVVRERLCVLAGENEALKREVGVASKRRTLLAAHRIKSQEEVELLKEYTRRITQRKEYFW